MIEVAQLALLGAILAMDGVTVGQFMVSRPLVAGFAAGLLLGDPAGGLVVGAILEIFLLVVVPSGGGRFPETGPAVVVGAAGAVWIGGPGGLAVGVALALVLGQLGAVTQGAQRHLIERWVPDPSSGAISARAVTVAHLRAIAFDGLRGFSVTLVGLLLVKAAGSVPTWLWPLELEPTRALLLVGGFVSLGIVARALLRRRSWVALVGGFVAGLALVRWLP